MEASAQTVRHGQALTPLQQEAMGRLQALEQAIYQEYGLRVACGIELEFYNRTADGEVPTESGKSFDLIKYNAAKHAGKTGQNSFIDSPFLERIESVKGTEKYEVVVGRELPASLERASPSTIARAALSFKDILQARTPELEPGHTARFWAIDEHPTRPRATSGLHVNVSLWDPAARKNLFSKAPQEENALLNNALHAGLQAQKALFPIIVESPRSLQRFQRRNNHSPAEFSATESNGKGKSTLTYRYENFMVPLVSHNHDDARLEHRLPGADADPILSTLMAVGGLYYGLRHGSAIDTPSPELEDIRLQKITLQGVDGAPQRELLSRCDLKPFIQHIPSDIDEYRASLTDWESNPIAREILGDKLLHELSALRTGQAASWQR